MAERRPAPAFGIGLFFGLLIGVFATLALSTRDTSETFEEYRKRVSGESSAGRAPHGRQASDPQQPPGQGDGGHSGARDAQAQMVKVHFMKKFVAALTGTPENMQPNPGYAPLLKDVSKPLRCASCHTDTSLDMDKMKRADPGAAAADPYRRQPRFMIPLMEAWVGRLNKLHADRLTKPVTCTDCHAIDPRDGEKRLRVNAPLMVKFVKALKTKPENKNPATNWKPLLKDPKAKSMLCAVCHGNVGVAMERKLGELELERPAEFADNRDFMIHLMERWMKRLNRDAAFLLVKPVACIDCHETDPRR